MVIDGRIFEELIEQAKSTPRLRKSFDLRNSLDDNS